MSTLARPRNAPVGRPRNDEADSKILRASLCLYGDAGISGFNLSKVSSLARVGKSSMYARWTNPDELLVEAFTELIPTPEPDGPDLRGILERWASTRVEMYVGPHAKAIRRVFVESATNDPAITAVYEYLYQQPVLHLRSRLWDFKSRGEIPNNVSVTRMVDAIEGSVLMRGFSIPIEYVPCFLTEIPEYVEALVSDQLRQIHPIQHINKAEFIPQS